MKKKIPLAVRNVLEDVAKQKGDLVTIEFEPDSIVTFWDSDKESNFYFEFIKIVKENGKSFYHIRYRPSSKEHLDEAFLKVGLSNFSEHFLKWKTLVEEINKPSSLFDDRFTTKYYNDLEPEFQIIDLDAEISPYSIQQQKRIVAFLDSAKESLNEQSDTIDKVEILRLIEETQNSITRSTKKEIITKIRKIVAYGFKIGLNVGEKLLIEFSTELAKKLLLGN
jgi:hypothetical protein